MKMKIVGLIATVCVALGGCTSNGGVRTERLTLSDGTPTHYSYVFVDSGVDAAGGQRIKIVDLFDHDSDEIVPEMRDGASSTGTLQDATNMSITATSAALISGHYYAKGQANRRPDSVNIQQSGGGAEAVSGGVAEGAVNVSSNSTSTSAGGEGGSVASGAVAVDNSTAVDVSAQGGKGGSTGDIDIGPVTASAKGGSAYSDSYSSAKLSNSNTNTLTSRPTTTTNNTIKFEAQPLQPKKDSRH